MSAAHRHAALLLHAAHPVDRTWLLGQLPAQDAALLTPLLDELEQLGMPRMPVALARADAFAEHGGGDPLQFLGTCCPEAMTRLLRSEPARLVGEVLACRAWPWQAAVLGSRTPRRDAVEHACEQALRLAHGADGRGARRAEEVRRVLADTMAPRMVDRGTSSVPLPEGMVGGAASTNGLRGWRWLAQLRRRRG